MRAFKKIFAGDIRRTYTQKVLTRRELAHMRAKAIRQGVWFRVLSRAERVYMELAIKVVDRVRSHLVAKLLASIIGKLLDAMRSRVVRVMEEIGRALARKLSRIAQSWGNISALNWAGNTVFIQYLSIIHINTTGTPMV